MMNISDELQTYEKILLDYHLPRVEDIPTIELYMDQVIAYLKPFVEIFSSDDEENVITASMINNYVKKGLIPPPNGKKYSRRHLMYIVTVFILKQILSLDEIKTLILHQTEKADVMEAYAQFRDEIEFQLKNCCRDGYAGERGQTKGIDDGLLHAAISIANKIYAKKVIALYVQKEKDEAAKKELEKRELEKKEHEKKKENSKKEEKRKK